MDILPYIAREVEGGCNKACTSKPQVWHKPHKKGKRLHEPDFIKNLSIKKVKGMFDSSAKVTMKSNRLNYDPRAFCYQKQKKLSDFKLEKLANITNGNCGVLLYAPNTTNSSSVTHDQEKNDKNVLKKRKCQFQLRVCQT